MLDIQRYNDLGRMQAGWLDARYHFSFANYHNPDRMGFGPLRVINDDRVRVGGGFDFHPHHDMEIITYVREGAITHRDNLGNEGVTSAGDVQVMSAGTGIVHSEVNAGDEDIRLYQIWIKPNARGVTPRWDARQFPSETGGLKLLVSGNEADADKGALFIHADAAVYGGQLAAGETVSHPLAGGAYLLVSKGRVSVDGTELAAGDGMSVYGQPELAIHAQDASEVVLIDLPAMHP